MIKERYIQTLRRSTSNITRGKNIQCFLFGSSLSKTHFRDVDLGIMGEVTEKDIAHLRQLFEHSTFPYSVDVVNFNHVSNTFKNNVFEGKLLWIKR